MKLLFISFLLFSFLNPHTNKNQPVEIINATLHSNTQILIKELEIFKTHIKNETDPILF